MRITPGEDDLQVRRPLIEEVKELGKGQGVTPHRAVNFIEDHQIAVTSDNPLSRHSKDPLHTSRNLRGRCRTGNYADPGIQEFKTGEASEAGQFARLQGSGFEQPHPEDAPTVPEGAGCKTGRGRRLPFTVAGIDLQAPLNHVIFPCGVAALQQKNPTRYTVGGRQISDAPHPEQGS